MWAELGEGRRDKLAITKMNLTVPFLLAAACHCGLFLAAVAQPIPALFDQIHPRPPHYGPLAAAGEDEATEPHLPPCPRWPVPVPLDSQALPGPIKTALETASKLLEEKVNKTSAPGIAASISYNGEVIYSQGFGQVRKDSSQKPTGDTIFRIASISKVFTTLTVYMLLNEGYISSLDDPFNKYCPNFTMQTIYYDQQNITLRQMMSQMAGLPSQAPCTSTSETSYCAVNTSTILQRLKELYLISPPYTRPSYSNLAFGLLGRCLIEKFFPSNTFEDFVQKHILDPLEMTNTGFNYTESVRSKMAVGYLPSGVQAPILDLGWVSPTGQMYSTANDLAKFAMFFYNVSEVPQGFSKSSPQNHRSKSLIKTDLIREMLLPLFVNPDLYTGFGTPWEIFFAYNYTILTKSGSITGYSSRLSFIPQLHLGVTTLYSGSVDTTPLEVYDALVPAFMEVLMPLQPLFPAPPDPSVYVGTYQAVPLAQATIKMEGKQMVLHLAIVGQPSATVYLSYRKPLLLQISYDGSDLSCFFNEIGGLHNMWVEFDPPGSSGTSGALSFPGLLYGTKLQRQN